MKKSKIFKLLTSILLSTSLILGTSMSALANQTLEEPSNTLLEEVTKLNDEGWNELISEIDPNQKPQTKDVYFKVIEDPENPHIETKEYTPIEYLAETHKNPRFIDPTTNWLHISYELYSIYGDNFSVLAGFQWQKNPNFQFDDMFLVGSDSNSVLPGSNTRVNFTYYPNPSVSMYTTYNSMDHRSQFKFEGGAVGADFNIVPSELNSQIDALPNKDSYFYKDRTNDRYLTKGNPKGVLGFTAKFAASTTKHTNIGFTYGHKRAVIGDANISVSSNGAPVLGGQASIGYDQAPTSVNFTRGSFIP